MTPSNISPDKRGGADETLPGLSWYQDGELRLHWPIFGTWFFAIIACWMLLAFCFSGRFFDLTISALMYAWMQVCLHECEKYRAALQGERE